MRMRARLIKPTFFNNEAIMNNDPAIGILFVGLILLADREGRLEDRSIQIRAHVFPSRADLDVDSMIGVLEKENLVVRYEAKWRIGSERSGFIQIVNFIKHQGLLRNEKPSIIPPPRGFKDRLNADLVTRTQKRRILDRDGHRCRKCGETIRLCIDHIKPVSVGGDSSDENLQVLCCWCNAEKNDRYTG